MELLSFLLLSFLHDAQGDQNYEKSKTIHLIQPFLIANHQNRIPISRCTQHGKSSEIFKALIFCRSWYIFGTFYILNWPKLVQIEKLYFPDIIFSQSFWLFLREREEGSGRIWSDWKVVSRDFQGTCVRNYPQTWTKTPITAFFIISTGCVPKGLSLWHAMQSLNIGFTNRLVGAKDF